MEVTISVRGTHTVTHAPERGTVRARVVVDGSDAGWVTALAADAVALARESLSALHAPAQRGPVTAYSVDQVSVHAHRPWTDHGNPSPLVHTASARISATFSDPAALGRWIVEIVGVDGLRIDGVDWDVSSAMRQQLERDARREAVRHALRQAQDYADALGLGQVHVREIDDRRGAQDGPMPRFAAMAAQDGSELFTPKDVEIASSVDAVFVVSRA
ncbi:MAG: SIMPL domain-containing protein [Aeromicrobium sp.]|uniref:SIMPL domain-containing protein n=1 Tax=Aeromicrobium sp. TaxID=1871063 RepID=UPI0039E4124E